MHRFFGKTVVIIGLSVEGQDSARYFLSQGSHVICADRREKEALGMLYDDLKKQSVEFSLGSQYLSSVAHADIVVRTPGMSLQTPELVEARKRGVEITSLTKVFFEECKAPIIGVTGTKGKGTTSTLIYEMLKKSGKKAYLGGNVGKPLLSIVDEIETSSWVVLELSSFQLEDCSMSPHIAVVLHITQDHLANYDPLATNFHKDRNAYVAAKENIVSHQTANDITVLFGDDETTKSLKEKTKGTVYFYSHNDTKADAYIKNDGVFLKDGSNIREICHRDEVKILGTHNLENIAAAALVAFRVGIPLEIIAITAKTFPGLPYRLEKIRELQGVTFINDSFSTVPETTIAAIKSFHAPMILILGGSEKGSDFSSMGQMIADSSVKACIVIGQMTGRIVDALQKAQFKGQIISGLPSMHAVVAKSFEIMEKGDVVLLSPACASFGMFANYKERGNQFNYEVSNL